jgi:TM2 domain-containing membrane protein YozV
MSSVVQVCHHQAILKSLILSSILPTQWVILIFFSLLIGTIFFGLDDKEYNPQTVISDRYSA